MRILHRVDVYGCVINAHETQVRGRGVTISGDVRGISPAQARDIAKAVTYASLVAAGLKTGNKEDEGR